MSISLSTPVWSYGVCRLAGRRHHHGLAVPDSVRVGGCDGIGWGRGGSECLGLSSRFG